MHAYICRYIYICPYTRLQVGHMCYIFCWCRCSYTYIYLASAFQVGCQQTPCLLVTHRLILRQLSINFKWLFYPHFILVTCVACVRVNARALEMNACLNVEWLVHIRACSLWSFYYFPHTTNELYICALWPLLLCYHSNN